MFGGVSPALLLRVGAKVDIAADDYMKEKLQENMLVQMISGLNASQILSFVAP